MHINFKQKVLFHTQTKKKDQNILIVKQKFIEIKTSKVEQVKNIIHDLMSNEFIKLSID